MLKTVLKLLAGGVLVLVLGFFAVGLFSPPVTFETSVEVDASIEDSWDVFMNGDATRWISGLTKMETVRGEPGVVGSQFRLVFDEGGRTEVVEEMVLNVRRHEEYAFTIESDAVHGKATVRFEDLGMRTRISMRNEMRGENPIWQSTITIMQGMMGEQQRGDLERLKALIESEHKV